MSGASGVLEGQVSNAGLFSKERTVAGPSFNRWLVPPAALAIHLCIGMAYGFSVFWLPMTKMLGPNANPSACVNQSFFAELFTGQCNWTVPMVSFTFTLFIFMLGVSAALWGAGWNTRDRASRDSSPRFAGAAEWLWAGLAYSCTSFGSYG